MPAPQARVTIGKHVTNEKKSYAQDKVILPATKQP